MIDKYIAKAIVEVALFLECSGEEVLDPDASVAAMEQMAANLQRASVEGQRELVESFRALAPSYGEHQAFVARLGEAFDLQ